MPLAAHIAQTGSVTSLLYTDPLYLNWFYPQVSELVHAGGILLYGNDFLSPLLNLAWLGIALFAGWCIGRPYGSGATSLAAVASVMAANLLVSRQPGNANNDVVAIALFLSAVALLVKAAGRERRYGPRCLPGCPDRGGTGRGSCAGHEAHGRPAGPRSHPRGDRDRGPGRALAGRRDLDRRDGRRRRLLVRPQPDRLGQPVPLAGHRADPPRRGAPGAPPLRDRPLRHRHRRLGEVLHARPARAARRALAGVPRPRRARRRARSLARRAGWSGCSAAVALLSAIAYLLTPLGASGPEGMPVGFRLNIRYLAPG